MKNIRFQPFSYSKANFSLTVILLLNNVFDGIAKPIVSLSINIIFGFWYLTILNLTDTDNLERHVMTFFSIDVNGYAYFVKYLRQNFETVKIYAYIFSAVIILILIWIILY